MATYKPKQQDGIQFSRDNTALLVIDPVNDFLAEGGAAWDLTQTTVKKHDVIGNLKKAIEGARERGIPVLYGPMAYTAEDYADEALQRRSGINRIMFERKMFLAGSWGADFHSELRPQGEDIVLLPHKGTDVFATDLPDHLQRLGVSHLVIAGMTANLCCESTGRRATEAGYDVTYLSNAIGSENLPSYEAAIHLNFPLIGNAVMKVDEFLGVLDAGGGEEVPIQKGDVVVGSDHGEIGTVKAVVEARGDDDAYLLVGGGRIFGSDRYVPRDAVVARKDREVFINVPKVVVGKMPWHAPPTLRDRHAKEGPRAADVEKLYRSRSPSGPHQEKPA